MVAAEAATEDLVEDAEAAEVATAEEEGLEEDLAAAATAEWRVHTRARRTNCLERLAA